MDMALLKRNLPACTENFGRHARSTFKPMKDMRLAVRRGNRGRLRQVRIQRCSLRWQRLYRRIWVRIEKRFGFAMQSEKRQT
jgi:hypothetical protein